MLSTGGSGTTTGSMTVRTTDGARCDSSPQYDASAVSIGISIEVLGGICSRSLSTAVVPVNVFLSVTTITVSLNAAVVVVVVKDDWGIGIGGTCPMSCDVWATLLPVASLAQILPLVLLLLLLVVLITCFRS